MEQEFQGNDFELLNFEQCQLINGQEDKYYMIKRESKFDPITQGS